MSEEAQEGEAEVKSGGKLKLIILAVAGLVLLGGGGGAAAYFLGLFGGDEAVAAADEHAGEDGNEAAAAEAGADGHGEAAASDGGHGEAAAEDGHGAPVEAPQIAFVEMPDVLVNLQTDGKRMRFLKLRVALETESPTMAQSVSALIPRIMDSFQMYLRALSVDEVKGSVGLQRLKYELMARINHAVEPSRIDDILVKEMLVQ